jgi:putative hydrolase of the HAD superfamily
MTSVVTFDVGQTLVDLDLDFLGSRLRERGITVENEALARALPDAWRLYDRLVDEGAQHPWHAFVDAVLAGAGVGDREPVVAWLYEQQGSANLWRRPIAPMVELVAELRGRGVRIAALSNSEGHLARLLEEIALAPLFDAIVDSGRVGVAKPSRRIFDLTLEQIGVMRPDVVVHVGDSWSADVEGALGAGWNAIWYQSRSAARRNDPRVPTVTTADETRAALAAFGV